MAKALKRAGFGQDVFSQSSTAKETVGTIRELPDGRAFMYCRAGSSNLTAGKLSVAAAVGADVMNEACAVAHTAGDYYFSDTMTSGTYAEDYFKGGWLHINDGTGEGQQYKITASTAVAASTAITLALDEPLIDALVATTSEYSIIHNPGMATAESTTLGFPVGVSPIDVTANYYYWTQVRGMCITLCDDTAAVGKPLHQSTSTSGAVSGSDYASYYGIIGTRFGTAGVADEYKPTYLRLL